MQITKYSTNIAEVEAAYAFADKDKKIIIEDENKIVVMVELTKEQAKKITKK